MLFITRLTFYSHFICMFSKFLQGGLNVCQQCAMGHTVIQYLAKSIQTSDHHTHMWVFPLNFKNTIVKDIFVCCSITNLKP